MAEHLDHGALKRKRVPCEYTEQHKSHVADTRVGHEPFQVGLRKGKQSPVKNAGDTREHSPRRNQGRGFRKERERESQDSVRAGLQQESRRESRFPP